MRGRMDLSKKIQLLTHIVVFPVYTKVELQLDLHIVHKNSRESKN